MYRRVVPWADSPAGRIRYVHVVNWIERQLERLRSFNPLVVDAVLASIFIVVGIAFVFGQDIRDDNGVITDGFTEPSVLAIVTVLVVCAPVAIRRRLPLLALVISSIGIVIHILIGWPEGALPLAMLFLTYTVGAWCPLRTALAGLAVVVVAIVMLGFADSPGLDTVGVLGILAQFIAVWAIGVALRSRRMATDSKVREAEERAEAERQAAARVLAEERLRIAQELHDVVAHSMSVIAVQAGVGAHVIDTRPEQARAALEAISSTSRGTLHELRQLLGVLRGTDDGRSNAPAHGLADLPQLVDDVRVAGVPVTLHVEGGVDEEAECVQPGVELSAYRIVQEALTNVIKHAGSPTKVDVTVRHLPGTLAVEVVDDGRGLAAQRPNGSSGEVDGGHGLVGMRERVELWGGELAVGPGPGGGYRVRALLPYGEQE
jgi:signal transduction histidine kinase